MAIITTDYAKSLRAESGPVAAGSLIVRENTIKIETSIADGDVFEMIPLFQDETVFDLMLISDDVDNDTDLTLAVGYSGQNVTDDPDAYIQATAMHSAAAVTRMAAAGINTAAEILSMRKVFTEAVDTTFENRNVATIDVTAANAGTTDGLITVRAIIFKGNSYTPQVH